MSRISTAVNDGGRSRVADEGDTMPSGLQKLKPSKSKRKTTKAEMCCPSGSSNTAHACHRYLGSNETTAIQSWNDTVPKKSARSNSTQNEQDPVIQAYLEAKLSLFRNAGVTGNLYSSESKGARSISSTQS